MMCLDLYVKRLLSMILWPLCKIIKVIGNENGIAIGRFYSTLRMEQHLKQKIGL